MMLQAPDLRVVHAMLSGNSGNSGNPGNPGHGQIGLQRS